jgi:predicted DNA-binding ribbon-helix-helix protein
MEPPETARHLAKRSLSLAGHRTSIALEPAFWAALEAAAAARGVTLPALVAALDAARAPGVPLASALRVFALAAARSDRTGSA